jgi:hypothetical protein
MVGAGLLSLMDEYWPSLDFNHIHHLLSYRHLSEYALFDFLVEVFHDLLSDLHNFGFSDLYLHNLFGTFNLDLFYLLDETAHLDQFISVDILGHFLRGEVGHRFGNFHELVASISISTFNPHLHPLLVHLFSIYNLLHDIRLRLQNLKFFEFLD